MKQFSGEYGCVTCNDKGVNTRGATSMHRLWPYTPQNTIRKREDVICAFKKAVESGKPVSKICVCSNIYQ